MLRSASPSLMGVVMAGPVSTTTTVMTSSSSAVVNANGGGMMGGESMEGGSAVTFLPPTPTSGGRASNSLDMEGVFYRLHSRLVLFLNRWTSPSARFIAEWLILINAFALLFMLAWFHVKYVSRAETNCVTQVLRRELSMIPQASHVLGENQTLPPQVIKLQVSGIWSHLEHEDAKSSAKLTKAMSAPSDVVAANLFKVWLQDPVFVYSAERGFLMLDENTRQLFKIREVNIRLKTETECFSGSLIGECERYFLDNFVGYDTVILNAFGALFDSKGFLYSVHSRELLNVAHVHSSSKTTSMAFKLGAVATTLFLFFITTTLVHHMLRETQERMLKFTFDLQVYVRRGLMYRHLVVNHVLGSLVFVPIMVGMLFFLFEFFNDQLLAFMVLAVVWVCELFSVMSLRTFQNVRVFPRLFFIYFCSFHLYFFLFPSGFSYMALTCCVVFLQHAMLSFFFRHEMPALLSGKINAQRQRDVLGQELLPEDVQATTGASLAVRALAGSRVNSRTSNLDAASSSLSTAAVTPVSSVSPPPPPVSFEGAFVVTPTSQRRKKRSTIHNEPNAAAGGGGDNGEMLPPVVTITAAAAPTKSSSPSSPPLSVGPLRMSGWPLVDEFGEEENSSQASGWEIGGVS